MSALNEILAELQYGKPFALRKKGRGWLIFVNFDNMHIARKAQKRYPGQEGLRAVVLTHVPGKEKPVITFGAPESAHAFKTKEEAKHVAFMLGHYTLDLGTLVYAWCEGYER